MRVPKFRSARRLVAWMNTNWSSVHDATTGRSRLDPDREEVFFKKNESPGLIASYIAEYSRWTGRLEGRFEDLIKCDPNSVLQYLRMCRGMEDPVSEDLLDSLKGHCAQLFGWAHTTSSRLPSHLEDSLDDPRYCYRYSKEILKGRLPSHLESVFFKDYAFASRYAFDVIRGFSPVRLPEELHNFMVLKSFEDPNNKTIKDYIDASENDPSKMGNAAVKS